MFQFKHLIFVLFYTFVWIGDSAGQASASKILEIGTGLRDFASIDRVVSPLTYSDIQIPVLLAFSRSTNRSHFDVRLLFAKGTIRSSSENFRETGTINLGFDHQRFIVEFNQRIRIWMGGQFSVKKHDEDPFFVSDFLGTGREESNGYFISSLGFSSRIEYSLNASNELSFRQNLPLTAYIIRPGYSLSAPEDNNSSTVGEVLDDGELVFIGKLIEYEAHFTYRYKITSRSSLTLNLAFHYLTYPDPFRGKFLSNALLIGYGFHL